ncbi:MAG TPA: lysylphosphatidylglycerol synthase transmembrane domain-containing protein [Bryobacteraceae bacterium]|nr:lysylphosphatidylglycerol synthase transmembrane domain-containing protein [Bryobacteraceae bacterium]
MRSELRRFALPVWLLPAVGYLFSFGCLVWVLHGVDYHEMASDIRSLHWGWVAFAVVADIGVYVYQAWRWNLLLQPVCRPGLWRSVQAIYVGLFSNEVMPLRPGELIRSYLQAHWCEVPFSVAFASAIIERLLDGVWLVAAFALVASRPSRTGVALPMDVTDLARALGLLVTVCIVALALTMYWKPRAHEAIPKTRWGLKLRVLIEDLHIMGRSRFFYMAAAASLPYLLLQVVPVYALIRCYDLDLGVVPALVVLVIWRLATVLPQAPGNIGSSQAALVLALALFGVDKTTASGLSLVMWAAITLPLLFGGFIALALTDAKLSDLRAHAKAKAAAPVPAVSRQGPVADG